MTKKAKPNKAKGDTAGWAPPPPPTPPWINSLTRQLTALQKSVDALNAKLDQSSTYALAGKLDTLTQQNLALSTKLDTANSKLDALTKQTTILAQKEDSTMATIDDIKTAVTNEGTVVASAVTLLQQLSAALSAAVASNDPAAVQSVLDQINASTQALADAVAANTPAAPAT